MPKLNYAYLKKEPAQDQAEPQTDQAEPTPPQIDIDAIKAKGKGIIELPNTGGYFIVTYHDMNRNKYGVLFTPDGKPIAMR